MLIPTQGKGIQGRSFFEADFGKTAEDFVMYLGIHEYKELDALNTFISFMIPIVYLILIIPLEYILELYSKYELLFVRMSFKEEKDKKIQRRHRWLVIKVCKLSVHKVLLFQKKYWYKMYSKMSVEGFEKLIEEFRNECNNER